MGRSKGYRPKAAVKEEVLHLRQLLSECRDDQWQRASRIMDCITTLLGHSGGPMNGKIEPRACRYCKYFGHTRQHCKKRKADEEEFERIAIDKMLKEDEELVTRNAQHAAERQQYNPRTMGQAVTFDNMGRPYTLHPDLGPLVGIPGGTHHGKWTYDANGNVVERPQTP